MERFLVQTSLQYRTRVRIALALCALVVSFLAIPSKAAQYYVDFESGANTNPGTISQPWKHCPGDANATDMARSANLVPGDTVYFKGGVVYRGSIALKWSGKAGSVITYDGAPPNWGVGKAIIDGTTVLSLSWTRCSSAKDARGNPNYSRIWYASAPTNVSSPFQQLFINDSTLCHFAQIPTPSDYNYRDNFSEWRVALASDVTNTWLRDPSFFTQSDSNYWQDAWIGRYVSGNQVSWKRILGFDPSTDTVTFAAGGNAPGGNQPYSVIGHPLALAREMEYVVAPSERRIYFYPPVGTDPNALRFSSSTRNFAFKGSSKSHLLFRNLKVQGYFADVDQTGGGGYAFVVTSGAPGASSDNTVANCDIINMRSMTRDWMIILAGSSNQTITNNVVTHSFGGGASCSSGSNCVVAGNRFEWLTRTCVYFAGVTNGVVSRNKLHNIRGAHSNGISAYSGCDTIEISYNDLFNIVTPITFEHSHNIDIIGNLVDCNGEAQHISEWGGMSGLVRVINNTFVNGSPGQGVLGPFGSGGADTTYVLRNNIIAGGGANYVQEANAASFTRDHNIYTDFASWNKDLSWKLKATEIDARFVPLTSIFMNPAAHDWRLIPGSLAVNAGADVSDLGINRDLVQTSRPAATTYDIGAHELPSGSTRPASPEGLKIKQ